VAAHKRNAPDLPLDVEDFAGTSFVAVPAAVRVPQAPATVKMLVGESSTQRRRAFV
jgi:hypothetical protein